MAVLYTFLQQTIPVLSYIDDIHQCVDSDTVNEYWQ